MSAKSRHDAHDDETIEIAAVSGTFADEARNNPVGHSWFRAAAARDNPVGHRLIEHTLVGRSLGVYRGAEEIGRGGMGVVDRAFDTTLRRDVALQVVAPEYRGDTQKKHRLMREARSAAALAHPSIVSSFAISDADGFVYIAMELVRGRTLTEVPYEAHEVLPPVGALEMVRAIA